MNSKTAPYTFGGLDEHVINSVFVHPSGGIKRSATAFKI